MSRSRLTTRTTGGAAAYSMTRVTTSSLALSTAAGVERRLRVVLDHQLAGLGRGPVDEHLDEPQRHVDAARHAGGGDDPPVEVLDDPVARRRRAVLGQRVAARPVRRRRQPVEQPGGGRARATGAHRRRERGRLVGRRAPSRARARRASAARVPTPPGNTTTSGVGSSSNVASTSMPRKPLSRAHDAALVADERDVEAGDALQHLVGPMPSRAVKRGNRGMAMRGRSMAAGSRGQVARRSGGGSRRVTRRGGATNVRRIVSAVPKPHAGGDRGDACRRSSSSARRAAVDADGGDVAGRA